MSKRVSSLDRNIVEQMRSRLKQKAIIKKLRSQTREMEIQHQQVAQNARKYYDDLLKERQQKEFNRPAVLIA